MTLEDYCLKPTRKASAEPTLDTNFFDDDFDLETEDDLPTDEDDEDDDDDYDLDEDNTNSKRKDNGTADESADDSGKGETS